MTKSSVVQSGRYPYGVNTYESVSGQIRPGFTNNKQPDYAMSQIKQARAYENIVDTQKEKLYKRKERLLALTNHWMTMDKQLQHKNEYEKIVDLLKNTKLKDLTHESMDEREKHLEKLFKDRVK
jgi:hypothetical protein